MTSSATSTEPSEPDLADEGEAPDAAPFWTRERAIVLGLALLPAIALVIGFYGSTPTIASFFLAGGWVSLVWAGNMLRKAVMAIGTAEDETPQALDSARRTELEREKKLLLKAIKEVEFDRDMGKLDDADAGTAIAQYRSRALEILKELGTTGGDYRAQIEKELARRASSKAVARPAGPRLELEAKPTIEPTTRPCASCGTGNDPDAVFCKRCATKL